MSGDTVTEVLLGVSCDYHDSAAAIVVGGRVVAAAEEERFTRVKHDRSLPSNAIAACLDQAGLSPQDVERIAFYEKPMTVVARYLATRQRRGPDGLRSFVGELPELLRRNLMVGYRLRRWFLDHGVRRPPLVEYIEHHHSHAAAAFYPSPFEEAAIITVDGLGEWATATVGVGERYGVRLLAEQRYPNSLGLVYSLVTAWCGFEPNDGEYKLMGLAPYGRPLFEDALRDVVAVDDHGGIQVDASALGWFTTSGRHADRLADRFGGPPRPPDAPLTQREADLAASVQRLTEETVLAMGHHAFELTGKTDLVMAGGVALNCVANGRLLREGPYERIWIQPAAGDAGSAIGAALALWHDVLSNPHDPEPGDGMERSFLGPGIDPEDVRVRLDELGIDHRHVTEVEELVEEIAERIDQGAAVGWFRGRMEFGPRALGHRSILADPRDPDVRRRLNDRVKRRESFRPFAPAVLAEEAGAWFELDHPSPYMLLVAPLRHEHLIDVAEEPEDLAERAALPRSTVPACTHVDGTARIQTVDEDSDPTLRSLLGAFHERTGVPMLLNTSFNLAGEPIVASIDDALRTASLGGLDLLVIEDCVIERSALEDLPQVLLDHSVPTGDA